MHEEIQRHQTATEQQQNKRAEQNKPNHRAAPSMTYRSATPPNANTSANIEAHTKCRQRTNTTQMRQIRHPQHKTARHQHSRELMQPLDPWSQSLLFFPSHPFPSSLPHLLPQALCRCLGRYRVCSIRIDRKHHTTSIAQHRHAQQRGR